MSFLPLSSRLFLEITSNTVLVTLKDKFSTLEDAEKAMMELYCERSQLKDGHTVPVLDVAGLPFLYT
ncbi:hypothetical protein HAX54_003946 [Datura stramonium]|uniref:Uncharacterized protein n=1 Tax=Datura stramonium TaxID=4076 RepID=A0ABS8RTQ6_DATST|nr:hypothetical protein [Datura stramonium]